MRIPLLLVLCGCAPDAAPIDTDEPPVADPDRDADGWTNEEEVEAASDPDDCRSVPPGDGHWPECRVQMERDGVEGAAWGVGQVVPGATFMDQYGQEVALHQLYGEVVVVALCALWCAPCHDHAEELQAIYEAYADEHVIVLNIVTDSASGQGDPSQAEIEAWAADHAVTFPVVRILDPQAADRGRPGTSLMGALEASQWPSDYLLDRGLVLQDGQHWGETAGQVEAMLD